MASLFRKAYPGKYQFFTVSLLPNPDRFHHPST